MIFCFIIFLWFCVLSLLSLCFFWWLFMDSSTTDTYYFSFFFFLLYGDHHDLHSALPHALPLSLPALLLSFSLLLRKLKTFFKKKKKKIATTWLQRKTKQQNPRSRTNQPARMRLKKNNIHLTNSYSVCIFTTNQTHRCKLALRII